MNHMSWTAEKQKPFKNPFKLPDNLPFHQLQSAVAYLESIPELCEAYKDHPISSIHASLSHAINYYALAFLEVSIQGCHEDPNNVAQLYCYLHAEVYGEMPNEERIQHLCTLIYGGRESSMNSGPLYMSFFADNPQFFEHEFTAKTKIAEFLNTLPSIVAEGRNPRLSNQFDAMASANSCAIDEYNRHKLDVAWRKHLDPDDHDKVYFFDEMPNILTVVETGASPS